MGNFLNTVFGSYLKVLVAALLTIIATELMNGKTIFDLDWKYLVNATVLSALPILINWLNPKDPRYGKSE